MEKKKGAPAINEEPVLKAVAAIIVFTTECGRLEGNFSKRDRYKGILEDAYKFALEFCGGENGDEDQWKKATQRLRHKYPHRRAELEAEARGILIGNPLAYTMVNKGGSILGSWVFRGERAAHFNLAERLKNRAADNWRMAQHLAENLEQCLAERTSNQLTRALAEDVEKVLSIIIKANGEIGSILEKSEKSDNLSK